jgi:hypothetical protein
MHACVRACVCACMGSACAGTHTQCLHLHVQLAILVRVKPVEERVHLILLTHRFCGELLHELTLRACTVAGRAVAVGSLRPNPYALLDMRWEGYLAVLLAAVWTVLPVGKRGWACKVLLRAQCRLSRYVWAVTTPIHMNGEAGGPKLLAAVGAALPVGRHEKMKMRRGLSAASDDQKMMTRLFDDFNWLGRFDAARVWLMALVLSIPT